MTYRTNDGQSLHATRPKAVVKELHKASHTPEKDDQAFMKVTASRVRLQFDKRVRTDSAEHFVQDLLQIGLLIDETDAEVAPSTTEG